MTNEKISLSGNDNFHANPIPQYDNVILMDINEL